MKSLGIRRRSKEFEAQLEIRLPRARKALKRIMMRRWEWEMEKWMGVPIDGAAYQCEGGWARNNARHLKCQRNGKLIPPFVT